MLEIALLVAPLFVLLGIGMAAGFAQRFRSAQAGLNAFVFNFALPAFILMALAEAPVSDGVPFVFVVASFVVPGLLAFAVGGATRLRSRVRGRRADARGRDAQETAVAPGPVAIASTYGNVGYLGVPIVLSVVGPQAALAAALGQLLHNVLFMVGYPLLKALQQRHRGAGSESRTGLVALVWRVFTRAVLVNPVMISVVLGLILGALPVTMPEVFRQSLGMLGQAAVPAAMFAVGLSIKPAFEGMRSGAVPVPAVLLASSVKLVVLPAVTILVLLVFGANLGPSWIAAAVIMAAMPVSSTASILVFEYDGDARVTSATTLVTSVVAVITIPLAILATPA